MKRVKAACIMHTLVFSQKPEMYCSKEHALSINHEEVEHYKKSLEKSRIRYQITDETEQEDGSVIVHVRKEYNKADVEEYFI